jgi:hypothetical protein
VTRTAWWRDYLQRALGLSSDQSNGDVEQVDAAISIAVGDPENRATIVALTGLSGDSIAELARDDAGVRYALARMDPIALTGNRALAASRDPGGAFDRFDPDSGEQLLSDAFISDRSKFVAWKLRQDSGGDLAITGDARWTFVDHAVARADGAPFTLTLEGEEVNAETVAHQVVFGTSAGDVIAGSLADDRLYGESGDDFLRGGAGSDYLEGGQGEDAIVGGRGDDELAGGTGDDDIDGGSGADRLQAGSGDDALVGGRGDDVLDGGVGDDTYTFEAGDGRDFIIDSDGRGRVLLDDIEITGADAVRVADGLWRSTDGALEFSYSGTADDPGVLSIRSADANGSSNDEIRIRNWQSGALGITLDAGSAPTADPLAVTDEVIDWAVPAPGRQSAGLPHNPAAQPCNACLGNPPQTSDVGPMLVAPDAVNTALKAFARIGDTPDITSAIHALDAAQIGVTAQDLSSAMLDFHDFGELAIDDAASEPVADLAAMLPTMAGTQGISIASIRTASAGGTEFATGRGSGQRE